jgi:signal recognition particle GTPase
MKNRKQKPSSTGNTSPTKTKLTKKKAVTNTSSALNGDQEYQQAPENIQQNISEQNAPSSTDGMEQSEPNVMIGNTELYPYITTLFGKLVKATEAANNLPQGDQYKFLQTYHPKFSQVMKNEGQMILRSISNLQTLQKGNMSNEPLVSEMEEITEQFDSTVDLLDQLLENVVCYCNGLSCLTLSGHCT